MRFEREYYENEAFWDCASTREEDSRRVREIAGLIPESVRSVLDVGCGNGLLVHQLMEGERRFERLIALDRSQTALRHVRCHKALASIDELPFATGRFDLVTCLEVLEHLPCPLYEAGLRELCRVAARYVLISVPFQQDLDKTLVGCPSCRTLFNPDYHLRSFGLVALRELLVTHGFACKALLPVGTKARLLGLDRILSLRGFRPGGVNPFAAPIPCPACGFMLPPEGSAPGRPGATGRRGGLRAWVKSSWPKRLEPNWMAALYARTA